MDNDLLLVLGNLVDTYGLDQVLEGLAGFSGERDEYRLECDLRCLIVDRAVEAVVI